MAEYKNDRKNWYMNFPILESNQENNWAHHKAGAIAVHCGNEGFKFYVIRATQRKVYNTYGQIHTNETAFVQLINCPVREISNTPMRKRVTERGFHQIYILDVDKYLENEARVFTEMMELAKLRLTQTDTIDKLMTKHGDIEA